MCNDRRSAVDGRPRRRVGSWEASAALLNMNVEPQNRSNCPIGTVPHALITWSSTVMRNVNRGVAGSVNQTSGTDHAHAYIRYLLFMCVDMAIVDM